MKTRQVLFRVSGFVVMVGLAIAAWFFREPLSRSFTARAPAAMADDHRAPIEDAKVLKLSPEARRNLGLVVKPVKLQTYWRTIQVPGEIVDRPRREHRRKAA